MGSPGTRLGIGLSFFPCRRRAAAQAGCTLRCAAVARPIARRKALQPQRTTRTLPAIAARRILSTACPAPLAAPVCRRASSLIGQLQIAIGARTDREPLGWARTERTVGTPPEGSPYHLDGCVRREPQIPPRRGATAVEFLFGGCVLEPRSSRHIPIQGFDTPLLQQNGLGATPRRCGVSRAGAAGV